MAKTILRHKLLKTLSTDATNPLAATSFTGEGGEIVQHNAIKVGDILNAFQYPVADTINFVTSEPSSPSDGDRYINSATGSSSGTAQSVTANYIYEWATEESAWLEVVPPEGCVAYEQDDDSFTVFDGTSWSAVAAGGAHTIASHSDTTATGAETETLTNGSDADALHAHAVNDTHVAGDGSDHADVATNTAASHAAAHTVASHSDTTATGAETETLTNGSDADALHAHAVNDGLAHAAAHTIASHSDTTATGAETETLTDGSDADALHAHAVNDTHVAGDGSDHADVATNTAASHAASHTVASHSDTTATGTELETLTDGSETALHSHAGGGGLSNIVEDITPQLGAALDINGFSIVSVSDGDIIILPNGTGDLILDNLKWPQADGTAGQALVTSGAGQLSWMPPPLQSVLSDTTPKLGGSLDVNAHAIVSISNGAILITPNGSGDVVIDGIKHPQADGTAGQYLKTDGSAQLSFADRTSSIGITIDGGGSAITTGIKGDVEIPFACTIEQVTMLADQSGSIVIDIWKDTYANYPPTDADTITASAVPTITTATKSQDGTLTAWTTSVAAGDILRFNVDSITTIERVTLVLKVKKL